MQFPWGSNLLEKQDVAHFCGFLPFLEQGLDSAHVGRRLGLLGGRAAQSPRNAAAAKKQTPFHSHSGDTAN